MPSLLKEIESYETDRTPGGRISERIQTGSLLDEIESYEISAPIEEHGMAGELAAGLGRGALRVVATPAYLADVAGEAIGWKGLEKAGEYGAEKVEKFIEESPRLRKSQSISGDIRDNPQLWTDPRWYLSLIGEGAPTIASMIIPGMAAAKAAQVAGWGAKGIIAARMGGALTAGMGLEAGGAAEDVRQYEKRTGDIVPISKKLQTVVGTGVVAGSLEAIPIFNLFGRTVAKKLIGRIITSMAFEGGTEGAQEIVANAFAKAGYDADRDMVGGVIESVVGGVLLGGGMGAMQQTFHDRINKTDPDEVADLLEQAEKEIIEPTEEAPEAISEDLLQFKELYDSGQMAELLAANELAPNDILKVADQIQSVDADLANNIRGLVKQTAITKAVVAKPGEERQIHLNTVIAAGTAQKAAEKIAEAEKEAEAIRVKEEKLIAKPMKLALPKPPEAKPPEAPAKEIKPKVEEVIPEKKVKKPFEPDLKTLPLKDITVKVKALREKTGEIVVVQENAKVAIESIDKDIERHYSMLECF